MPDCLWLSVALLEHEVVFTMVASDAEMEVLGALQHLIGDDGATDEGHARLGKVQGDDVVDAAFDED